MFEQYKQAYITNNECHLTRDTLQSLYPSLNYQIKKIFGSFTTFKDEYNKHSSPDIEEYNIHYDVNNGYLGLQKQNARLTASNNELRFQNRLLLKQINSQDQFYDKIINNLPEVKYTKVLRNDLREEDIFSGTAVLHLSDLHYGEVVTFGDVTYDCAIAERRLSDIISQFCCIARNYKKCVIVCNGDLINGNIRTKDFENGNEMTVIECVMRMSKLLTESIILIYEYLRGDKELSVVFTVGNHSRTIPGDIYYKNKVKENWEYLLGEMVKKEIGYILPDVWVEVSNTPSIVLPIEDLKFAITHGDCFKSLSNMRLNATKFYDMCMSTIGDFDHMIIGHFHQFNVIPFMRGLVFVNGALKDCDEYSVGNCFSIDKASQTCICVNGNAITSITPLYVH